jgi:hypothetical protein
MLSTSTEMIMSICHRMSCVLPLQRGVQTENEAALNALTYTIMVHLFLHYHVYFCMFVFCFLATEQMINPKSCCGVLWTE